MNNSPKDDIVLLSQRLIELKDKVRLCNRCHNLSEGEECSICSNSQRNRGILCVVERPNDVTSIEKAGTFNGLYHVLLGAIDPLEGRGPAQLKIDSLIQRIKQENIQEVIIATDSDTEGETTALYLTKLIKPLEVCLSRIGLGLPVGSNLEYADSATLSKPWKPAGLFNFPLMINLNNLSKNYGSKILFEKVSLSINRGEKVGLIGPNGAGKSTLFL